MKQKILLIVNLISLVLTTIFGVIWIKRLRLNYNEEGKHFDEAKSVVYDIDALPAYGVLMFIFAVIAATCWTMLLRHIQSVRGKS